MASMFSRAAFADVEDRKILPFPRRDAAAFSSDSTQLEWMRRVSLNLEKLSALQPNWDTYGGVPPTRSALTYAGMVVSSIWDKRLALPHVSATSSGAIMFEWENDHSELLIEVQGASKIGYVLASKDFESAGEASDSMGELQRFVTQFLDDEIAARRA